MRGWRGEWNGRMESGGIGIVGRIVWLGGEWGKRQGGWQGSGRRWVVDSGLCIRVGWLDGISKEEGGLGM